MIVCAVVKSVKPIDVTPVMVVNASPAVTTGGVMEKFEPEIEAVAPAEQSAPVPFLKFGTKNVTCQPASAPDVSVDTNGALLAEAYRSGACRVNRTKLANLRNP